MKIKPTLLITLLFLCSAYFAKSQQNEMLSYNFSAQYKKTYKPDSLQKNNLSENFILLFNDHQSAFRSVTRFLLDSIKRTPDYQSMKQLEKVAVNMEYPSNNEELIQINLDQKEATVTTFAAVMPATDPSYKEKLNLQWKIIDEFKKIKNLNCKKAEVTAFGRKWTAWFTLDHPYPVGPYKFQGLPGLIVQIEDATSSYKYELYKFKTEKVSYPTIVHDNVKLMSKNEFKTIYESGRYGMSLYAGIELDEDRYKRIETIKRNLKLSENNPIELIP